MKKVTVLCAALVLMAMPAAADFIVINEAFCSHTGTDNYEFIELVGTPGMDLSSYSIIRVESDAGTGVGVVDGRFNLTGYTMPMDGYFVLGDNAVVGADMLIGVQDQLENSTETILLVQNCLVVSGNDIDTDNNCTPDVNVGTVVDGLCVADGGILTGDCAYFGVPIVGPDGTLKAAGGARCPDVNGAFRIMCFTNPLVTCDVNLYSNITVGAPNDCPVTGTDNTSWGNVKTLFR